MKSTKAMRDRCRELTDGIGQDDYDRAVLCILDDLEEMLVPTEVKLKTRSEAERLRYVLQKIADFPCGDEQMAQHMQLMARGALASPEPGRGDYHDDERK